MASASRLFACRAASVFVKFLSHTNTICVKKALHPCPLFSRSIASAFRSYAGIKYTTTHEWIVVDNDIGTVGISDYAQEELGDIVFIELPEIGASLTKAGEAAIIESVKAASDVYAPVTGEVTEVNNVLKESPEKVNESPEKDGWLYKMKVSDPNELDDLMDGESYITFADAQGH